MHDDQPWSHEIEVTAIPPEGLHIELVPDAETRARLAKVADVLAITELKATLDIRRMADEGVDVVGELRGVVRQTCVVSLEEFENPIEEKFAVDFAVSPKGEASTEDEEEIEDLPDPIIDGKIDLGTLVTEFVILAIDPYPRKPGAEFESPEAPQADAEGGPNPFERLSSLKNKLSK